MTQLHFKCTTVINGHTISVTPYFKCCDNKPKLLDVVSCTDHCEFVIKRCNTCGTLFKEETIFGKQSAGYPHVTTFSY